jgi:hypothetical protein
MTHWTDFGLSNRPPLVAREPIAALPPPLQALAANWEASMAEPVTGIRNGPELQPGLFPLHATGVSTQPILDAALAFLDALPATQRAKAVFPIDAAEWRTWLNMHFNLNRHGVLLEDLPQATRDLGLGLLRATLSERGFAQARDVMRINGFLVEITQRASEFGEWPYFLSIFGQPAADQPWGWQIDGHHLNLNCVIIGDQMVMTPSFMGSEPCAVDRGPMAGKQVFVDETRVGLDMVRSLHGAQTGKAILMPSINPDDLPEDQRLGFAQGYTQAAAYQDNARIDFEGIRATDFSDAQRRMLETLVATYVGWSRDGHAGIKMAEVQQHLDETWFSWKGNTLDDGPFYYRVQSPVVLIEFEHQPGIVFDNKAPSAHHVHTVVRTPNGGDYGVDLLRQHHERYDHSHGHHKPHGD